MQRHFDSGGVLEEGVIRLFEILYWWSFLEKGMIRPFERCIDDHSHMSNTLPRAWCHVEGNFTPVHICQNIVRMIARKSAFSLAHILPEFVCVPTGTLLPRGCALLAHNLGSKIWWFGVFQDRSLLVMAWRRCPQNVFLWSKRRSWNQFAGYTLEVHRPFFGQLYFMLFA